MNSTAASAGLLIVLVVLSGCHVPDSGTSRIGFTGNVTATDDSFRMEGYVSSGGIPDTEVYDEVSLGLYERNGQRIESVRLGSLEANGEITIDISRDWVPYYVVIESPDFWDEPMTVRYYQWTGEQYAVCTAAAKDELPDGPPPSREPGERVCP